MNAKHQIKHETGYLSQLIFRKQWW